VATAVGRWFAMAVPTSVSTGFLFLAYSQNPPISADQTLIKFSFSFVFSKRFSMWFRRQVRHVFQIAETPFL